SDMIRDHPDTTYSSFLDQTRNFFTRAKEVMRHQEFDVVFLGYRLVDSYCHFQHTETRNGKPYRQHLIDHIQSLLSEIDNQIDGDLMFFSDHGQTELTHTFRVNRWLKQNGWLDYKVDYDFIDTLTEYQGGEMHPVNERVENQFTFGRPGVKLIEENSQVVCADPFDSCLTLLVDREDFDEERFREELMSTGMYRSVKYKWELYDEDADFYESVPDIIPDRKEGVFVSGNLHDNPIGMGYYRTGVHDRGACFGATKELNIPDKETIKPEDMYDIITDFIGLEVTEAPLQPEQVKQWTKDEVELAHENIEAQLGEERIADGDSA
ncbi:MAG: alkaline phosphatase family protein, partial [Candidatus Nanohaloarchaea archaeon]